MENNREIEIDVMRLVRVIWGRKFLVMIIGIIFGALAYLSSSLLIEPSYTSSTRIYVVNNQSDSERQVAVTTQDLQAGTYLVKDYKEIIMSSDVMEQVVVDENLAITEGELRRKVKVNIPTDTRIITISVTDHENDVASDLANAIRRLASEKIKNITKVSDVTVIEEAKPELTPSSPNIKRNTVLAMLIGMFLTVATVLMVELLNDTLRRPEDVEETLGMTLLGVVPDTDKLN